MNIYVGFKENDNGIINLKGTIYNYSNTYCKNNGKVKIFSNQPLSKKEIESLGEIYFNDRKILEKGYIDLVIDKYIINFI